MAVIKKKKPAITFALGWSGVVAVGIVCFCIFLWMFLLGVWTGQTLLEPTSARIRLGDFASKIWQESNVVKTPEKSSSVKTLKGRQKQVKKKSPPKVPSIFSLQVASFHESSKARKVVLQWRARDYDSFYLAPEKPDGTFYRVFVGRFDTMDEAKKMVTKLAVSEKNKYFIALIPSKEKTFP